jgi:ATP-dependent helicase/DNAse subunit B
VRATIGRMPLTLVLGPANSAKAGEVLGAFAAAASRGAVLVVPTAEDASHYARELAGEGAVLGSVLTFSGLAREVARRAGYSAWRLTPLQRERLVRRAVAAAELEAFAPTAGTPGFTAAATALIAELERSRVSPARLSDALVAWADRPAHAEEIARMYSAYHRELERVRAVDGELYTWRALDALRANPSRWGSDDVFFYGFDDLHGLQRDAVETLAEVVGAEVTLSLTYEPGRAALSARAEIVEELRPLARDVHELPALDEHYEPDSRAALHHLERHLFEPATQRVEPNGAVALFEAGGERAEAELVAAEILTLLRHGVPAEDIVVVYRSPAGVAPLLERVFEQYGISLAAPREVPFGHTAIGRSILGLARCAWLGPDRAGAGDLLDYVRAPGVLADSDQADRLEADIRRKGLRTAGQAAARLPRALPELEILRDATDPLAELGVRAGAMLSIAHRGSAAVLGPDEELDARAVATMLRANEELAPLGEGVEAAELIELLAALPVRAGRGAQPGAVLLSEPLAIRARRFRAVFVCGLQEGAFPRPDSPEPFLSDEDRRELATYGGLRLGEAGDGLARERYLFYSCLARATERVVLSYRSSDEEGNLALPSPFVADVAELLAPGWAEHRRHRLLADVVWPTAEAPTERERARAEAALAAPPAGEPVPAARVLSEVALRHVRHREILSGGALESFADCPVRWLVERELQPNPLEPDSDALTRGSYMHAVLERVLERLGGPVTPDSLPDALAILQHVLEELPVELAPGRLAGVRAAARRAIEADLQRYLAHEADDACSWTPSAIELRFGFEDEEPPLAPLELGEGPERIRLRGVIDRVDVAPDGRRAVVRDYKSGSTRQEYAGARWAAERQLQVALYMLAVRNLLGLEPVAGVYQPLGGGDLRARGMFAREDGAQASSCLVGNDGRDREEFEAELTTAADRAIELAGRLRSGQLTPCPETCSRDGCKYPGICRST